MDPINRQTYQLVADIQPLEMDNCLMQLADFIPPENRNLFDPREIRKEVSAFLRKTMLHCNITINQLIFEITVQIVLGESIHIYIRRIDKKSSSHMPIPMIAEPVLIYESKKI
jgi:hypothetical protein